MSTLLDREGLALLVIALLVVVFLVVGGWFLYHPPERAAPDVEPIPAAQTAVSSEDRPDVVAEIVYPGRAGATVLELLNEEHRVRLDTELLLFGSIVLEIDSLRAAPDEYWVFYRDTIRGNRPPELCTTQTGEMIHWVLKRRR